MSLWEVCFVYNKSDWGDQNLFTHAHFLSARSERSRRSYWKSL